MVLEGPFLNGTRLPDTAPGMLVFANHLEPLPSFADLLPVGYFVDAVVKLKHLVDNIGCPRLVC